MVRRGRLARGRQPDGGCRNSPGVVRLRQGRQEMPKWVGRRSATLHELRGVAREGAPAKSRRDESKRLWMRTREIGSRAPREIASYARNRLAREIASLTRETHSARARYARYARCARDRRWFCMLRAMYARIAATDLGRRATRARRSNRCAAIICLTWLDFHDLKIFLARWKFFFAAPFLLFRADALVSAPNGVATQLFTLKKRRTTNFGVLGHAPDTRLDSPQEMRAERFKLPTF